MVSVRLDDFRHQLRKPATSRNEMLRITRICERDISIGMRNHLDFKPFGFCILYKCGKVLLRFLDRHDNVEAIHEADLVKSKPFRLFEHAIE